MDGKLGERKLGATLGESLPEGKATQEGNRGARWRETSPMTLSKLLDTAVTVALDFWFQELIMSLFV